MGGIGDFRDLNFIIFGLGLSLVMRGVDGFRGLEFSIYVVYF